MVKQKEKTIFVSCSKDDKNLQFFKDTLLSREVEYKAIFMEVEDIEPPPYKDIQNEINKSDILFVLLSSALTKPEYLHTANWVSFEIGLAVNNYKKSYDKILPVWIFEPFNENINFTVPYIGAFFKYMPDDGYRKLIRMLLRDFKIKNFSQIFKTIILCPNKKCKLKFAYPFSIIYPINCPSCNGEITKENIVSGISEITKFKNADFW